MIATRAMAAAAVVAAALVPLLAAPAHAETSAPATQCVFLPALPKHIAVGQPRTTVAIGLNVSIKDATAFCAATYRVSARLTSGSDGYALSWNQHGAAALIDVRAARIVPGTYAIHRTTCSSTGPGGSAKYTCSVTAGTTMVKFVSHALLAATRSGSHVHFVAFATRYSATGTKPFAAKVEIQRRSGSTWRTVHTVRANAKGAASWSYGHAARAKYRAVTSDTESVFGDTSIVVTR